MASAPNQASFEIDIESSSSNSLSAFGSLTRDRRTFRYILFGYIVGKGFQFMVSCSSDV